MFSHFKTTIPPPSSPSPWSPCGASALSPHPDELAPRSKNLATGKKNMSPASKQPAKDLKRLSAKQKSGGKRPHIISLRIDNHEKGALDQLAKTTSKSISDILREAIDLWSCERHKLCTD